MRTKQLLIPIIVSMASFQSEAATFFGVTAGANFWQSEAEVQAGEVADAQFTFKQKKESNTELFFTLEHPIPLVPNLKYLTSDLNVTGQQTLSQTYILNGQTFKVASTLAADYQYDYSDYSLYYELFDNKVLEFDLGVTLKDIDATYKVSNAADVNETASRTASGIEPYLYTSAKVKLPLLNLGFSSQLNVQDGSNYDFEIAVQYRLGNLPAIQPYLQVGWKKQEVDFEDFDSLYFKHSWDAAFAGIVFEF